MDKGMFDTLGTMLFFGFVSMCLLIIVSVYALVSWLVLPDIKKSHTLIVPQIHIKSETVNGITKSDAAGVWQNKEKAKNLAFKASVKTVFVKNGK